MYMYGISYMYIHHICVSGGLSISRSRIMGAAVFIMKQLQSDTNEAEISHTSWRKFYSQYI